MYIYARQGHEAGADARLSVTVSARPRRALSTLASTPSKAYILGIKRVLLFQILKAKATVF